MTPRSKNPAYDPRRAATESIAARRGLVLPVILLMLLLLALLVASFSLQVEADYAAGRSMSERLQTRLAAEAGIQKVMYMLRTERDNVDAWYHNPEMFDQALVWSEDAQPEELGRRQLLADAKSPYAYRYSIVADDPNDDEYEMRFGITDEAAKLNINTATEEQLTRMITPVTPEGQDPRVLVQSLMDWRDEDSETREYGAEIEYYQARVVPYRPKNAAFETVEELLMVRGFTGQILYGEDYDRNGLLTKNEDDAEISFPLDDGDGLLDKGLFPYITVYSQEFNVANDNKTRINLLSDRSDKVEKLREIFDEHIVQFIIGATRTQGSDKTRSLADYLESRIVNNSLTTSPITGQAAVVLFDKCTVDDTPQRLGLINVMTAPPRVLACIEGLAPEKIPTILQKRAMLTGPIKATTAWLVTEQILTADEYNLIKNQITSRGRQFTIESIGFSDHLSVYTRLQVVVGMRGPMAQILYYRDLTKLGLAYPIRGEEGNRSLVIKTE
jgi:type II secretory pathway component PulK